MKGINDLSKKLVIKIHHQQEYFLRLFVDGSEVFKELNQTKKDTSTYSVYLTNSRHTIQIVQSGSSNRKTFKFLARNFSIVFLQHLDIGMIEKIVNLRYDIIYSQFNCDIVLHRDGIMEFDIGTKYIKNILKINIGYSLISFKNKSNVRVLSHQKDFVIPMDQVAKFKLLQVFAILCHCLPMILLGLWVSFYSLCIGENSIVFAGLILFTVFSVRLIYLFFVLHRKWGAGEYI